MMMMMKRVIEGKRHGKLKVAEKVDLIDDLISVVKFVIHETCDDAGFSHRLVTQKHQFVLCKS